MFKKIFKYIKFSVILVVFWLIAFFSLYIYALVTPKPDINKARSYYLYDKDSNLVFNNNDEWISLDNISDYLIDATIYTEDKKFYKHSGFDFLRIIKAVYVNLLSGSKKEGASTITQQYARNLFLNFDKTWKRKFDEAKLALELECHYKKEEILEGYLNTINYGGVFGIENASKYYFGKSASELNLAEASMLAGIPKSPSTYSPLINPLKAKKRQGLILSILLKNKVISENDYNAALNYELVFKSFEDEDGLNAVMYYQDAVINELKKIESIPNSLLETGGLKIYTTLDKDAQKYLENATNKYINKDSELQSSSIMMDPNTGEVLALMGGVDYNKSQFNRATSAVRQVGSTMKPFLYYAALENGFTASSAFISERTTFTFSGNKTYSPKNYNDRYPNKQISLGAAISYSDNIYAVKTHLFLGENNLVEMAKRLGIKSNLEENPSLALGTNEINILEMMKAYATFANEGYKIEPHLISRVEDENGNILYQAEETKENVLNRGIVYVLNELLTCTYSKELVDYDYPTMINYAAQMTNKYAVKTGSTDYDRLIFGYNKDLIVGVWTGYDNNRRIESDKGKISKKIWIETMEGYLKDKNSEWYEMPNNVVGVLTDPVTGELATNDSKRNKIMYYIKGTEPRNDNISLDDVIPTIKEDE